jgi:hypothetical protein
MVVDLEWTAPTATMMPARTAPQWRRRLSSTATQLLPPMPLPTCAPPMTSAPCSITRCGPRRQRCGLPPCDPVSHGWWPLRRRGSPCSHGAPRWRRSRSCSDGGPSNEVARLARMSVLVATRPSPVGWQPPMAERLLSRAWRPQQWRHSVAA